MKQFLSIQYLRALAVLGVLAFHEAESAQTSFAVGQAGVDLFFVISGFIMCMVTEQREADPKLFVWRRLTRVVPLYWVVTCLTAIVCLALPRLLWAADARPAHLAASLLFIPHTNSSGHDWPTVLQGWTLNIEMYFYLVIALGLFLPRRFQVPAVSAVLLAAVALGAYLQPHSPVLKAYSNGLLPEFVAGLWIGKLCLMERLPGRSVGFALIALGALIFCGDPWINYGAVPALRAVSWGIPAALMVLGAVAVEAHGRIAEIPVLKLLGDASYSIYLLHDLVISVAKHLPLPALPKSLCAIALALAIGILSFMFFERPVNLWLRRWDHEDGLKVGYSGWPSK